MLKEEKSRQKRFLQIMGSKENAERLQQIWGNSSPSEGVSPLSFKTKLEVFIEKAIKEGFSRQQVDTFLDLP